MKKKKKIKRRSGDVHLHKNTEQTAAAKVLTASLPCERPVICGGKLGCTGGQGEHNKTQQNLTNKRRKHNINRTRQKFLEESNNIPPNCRPVEKVNFPEHRWFSFCSA